jgi:hypothetical protein
MRQELAACANTDEALDIRQRARAAEIYAKQVNDTSAEHQLASIRLRAERRLGELLKNMDKNPGAKGIGKKVQSDGATTLPPRLSDLGISKDQSCQFQQLAAIPTEQFEEAVSGGDAVPTTGGVLARAKRHSAGVSHKSASRGMPPLSQWVRSQLLAFDTTGTLSLNAADIFAQMSRDERRDVARVARLLLPWLQAMIDASRKVQRVNKRTMSQAAKAARIAETESDQRQMVLPAMRGQHDQSGER